MALFEVRDLEIRCRALPAALILSNDLFSGAFAQCYTEV